ncbi:hypothetical protein ACH35V_29255 [Actinomadura sp. 1N219]|uniref:hypothetical protein n=1 Tax=Actinomadura sp. 1N219 TaxID=3375152 RepID=UPI00378FE2EA
MGRAIDAHQHVLDVGVVVVCGARKYRQLPELAEVLLGMLDAPIADAGMEPRHWTAGGGTSGNWVDGFWNSSDRNFKSKIRTSLSLGAAHP